MNLNFSNEREFLEGMADLFIVRRQMDKAIDAFTMLTQRYPIDAKILLLSIRIADIYSDYERVIHDGEAALTMPITSPKDMMMIHNVVANAYDKTGDIARAADHYLKSCHVVDGDDDLIDERREDYSNYLFALHRLPTTQISSDDLTAAVTTYNEFYREVKAFEYDMDVHRRHEKIRVGYVSPDLRNHVVARFAMPFFTNYDHDRFEVTGYAACKEDDVSEIFKSHADRWINVMNDAPKVAAKKIFDDEIDILVDLSGHTSHNCLPILAHKPAPIQISGIGWIGSTGLKAIDYFIVDRHTVPDTSGERLFSERVIRLPHTHFCCTKPTIDLPVDHAPCIDNRFVTFGSFNNFSKVTDDQLRLWARIMSGVDNARLFIKSTVLNTRYTIDRAMERCRAAGLDDGRITVEYGDDYAGYLRKMKRVDIMLDTFPYVGGGTTCDALYMGVPVVSLVGDRHGSRFGLSFLTNVGVAELCAFTADEYVDVAIALANDVDRLDHYHLTLRRSMEQSPLMDAAAYMSDIESAYESIIDDVFVPSK